LRSAHRGLAKLCAEVRAKPQRRFQRAINPEEYNRLPLRRHGVGGVPVGISGIRGRQSDDSARTNYACIRQKWRPLVDRAQPHFADLPRGLTPEETSIQCFATY